MSDDRNFSCTPTELQDSTVRGELYRGERDPKELGGVITGLVCELCSSSNNQGEGVFNGSYEDFRLRCEEGRKQLDLVCPANPKHVTKDYQLLSGATRLAVELLLEKHAKIVPTPSVKAPVRRPRPEVVHTSPQVSISNPRGLVKVNERYL